MNYVKRFVLFWYHFVVGDDWRIALAVVLGLTTLTLNGQQQLWWLLPLLVMVMLTLSLWTATRRRD